MTAERLLPYLEAGGLCRHPIFVIGSPRSGTTALATALGRHPQLWVSKESYFLHQLYGNGRVDQVWEQNMRRATPSWLRHERVSREELLGFLGIGINALYSSRSGGRRWVEQTPLYTPMVTDLADMFPGAMFLHVVRDGRAVVRSMSSFRDAFDEAVRARLSDELPRWTEDFRNACETWRDWVERASAFHASHPDRCWTVGNEALVLDPGAELGRVLEFLGLEPNDDPAAFLSTTRINSSFRHRPERPSDGDFEEWPGELRRAFVEIAGATLVDAGYATRRELDEWAGAAVP